jgi:hypothetical protein
MNDIANGDIDGVIKIMFFYKEHQENHTLQYTNMKSDYMKISKDGSFIVEMAKKVIEEVSQQTKQLIKNTLEGIDEEKEKCKDDNSLKKLSKAHNYIESRLNEYIDKTEVDETEPDIDEYNREQEKKDKFKTDEDKTIKRCIYN